MYGAAPTRGDERWNAICFAIKSPQKMPTAQEFVSI